MTEVGITRTESTGTNVGVPRVAAALVGLPVEKLAPPPGTPLLLGELDPAGWIVVAVPGDSSASTLAEALAERGFERRDIRQLGAAEMNEWLRSLLFDAGQADEVRKLRDFYIQALEGSGWLMVRARDAAAETRIAEEAQRAGARSITKYEPAPLTRH